MKIRTAIFGVYVAASAVGFAVLMSLVLRDVRLRDVRLRDVRLRYVEAMRRTMGDTASFLAVFAGEAAESEANWAQRLSGLPPKAELLRVFASDVAGRVIFDSTRGRDVGQLTPGR